MALGSGAAEAFAIVQRFPAAPSSPFLTDRHYLLYARAGTMTLEADGKRWTLPPARAAIIPANQPIRVALPRPVEACSVLFDAKVFSAPAPALTVVDMTPLARELIHACSTWTDATRPLDSYGRLLFEALAAVVGRLAQRPSLISMPVARSREVAAAVRLVEDRLTAPPDFEAVALEVGSSPRSLARKMADELGLTWRQTVQRLRMIEAITRLSEAGDVRVTAVAFAVGYESLSAFNVAFRELTGTTPTQYRRALQAANTGFGTDAPTARATDK